MSQLRASANAAIGYMEQLFSPMKGSPSSQLQSLQNNQSLPSASQASVTPKKRKRQSGSKLAPSPIDGQPEIPLTVVSGQTANGSESVLKKRGRPPGAKTKAKGSERDEASQIDGNSQSIDLPAMTPKKRGRPFGSRNKPKDEDHGPHTVKRSRLQKELISRRKSMGDLVVPAESLTLAGAVNTCMNFAMTVGSSFARPSILPDAQVFIPAQSYSPQTPKKPRKSTSSSSPHFLDNAKTPAKRTPTVSAHFSPKKRAGVSVIKFPPLKAQVFGLIQEELASQPFQMLIAVLFLARTTGNAAIPVIRNFTKNYPTAESLAAAKPEDLMPDINHLGLGSNRSQALVALARAWVANPPQKGKRYKRLNYPTKRAGKDILPRDEPLNDEDTREAYEVAHLPGIGPYGLDSWRIFCRDELREVSTGLKKGSLKDKEAAIAKEMQQEWTKVLPADKELRAYLKWRWLRLGVNWDPDTGDKKEVDRKILKRMQRGEILEHEGLRSPWTSD